MIKLHEDHHLGFRAFILIFIKDIAPGFALFMIAFIFSIVQPIIGTSLFSSLQQGATGPTIVTPSIVSNLPLLINLLFFISFIVMIFGIAVAFLEYSNYTYSFEEFFLKMKRGVIRKKEVALPYRQIQDVNIYRNLWHIVLGLSTIVMQTAGHEDANKMAAEVMLEPIDADLAIQIRDMLERQIGVQVVVDAKTADQDSAKARPI